MSRATRPYQERRRAQRSAGSCPTCAAASRRSTARPLSTTTTVTSATCDDANGQIAASSPAFGDLTRKAVSAGSAAVMGARFYAPSLGAFTQADTYAGSAANPASMNRFLYAEANPATLIDPTGHNAIVEDGVIIREAGLYSAQQNRHNRFTRYRAPTHGSRTLGQVTSRWRARGLASEIDSQWSRSRPRPVGSPTTTWRNKYNAVIADFNSRLTPLDEHGLLVEAVRTHEARTGYASTPYTFRDALDNLGMLPVLGTPADIASAIGYAREGDLGMAGLSVLGILSIGDAIKAGRKGAKALEGAAEAITLNKVAKDGDLLIGKMDDMTSMTSCRSGDYCLHLPPLPPGPGRWDQNAERLQKCD